MVATRRTLLFGNLLSVYIHQDQYRKGSKKKQERRHEAKDKQTKTEAEVDDSAGRYVVSGSRAKLPLQCSQDYHTDGQALHEVEIVPIKVPIVLPCSRLPLQCKFDCITQCFFSSESDISFQPLGSCPCSHSEMFVGVRLGAGL